MSTLYKGHRFWAQIQFPIPTSIPFVHNNKIAPSQFLIPKNCTSKGIMAASISTSAAKKLIQIDISSDTVCPWCFVGKKNLDKAIAASKDQYNFEIRWHPFQLDPNAPKDGIDKREYYGKKFGPQFVRMEARMSEVNIVGKVPQCPCPQPISSLRLDSPTVFKNLGLEYSLSGLTGNTLDSHRLIYFTGQQSPEKQHNIVEEICMGYFTQGKYVGNREFLLECASKAGVDGAAEFLQDPNNGVEEVKEELENYSANISGVPFYLINNGKEKLSGGQPPEVFLRAFKASSN